MKHLKRTILPIIIAGFWINISEAIRWELLIKSYWVEYYENLNLVFPNELINNLVWMLWGFFMAIIIFILSRKFNLFQTTLLSWLAVFIMLWIVLWNIRMFPTDILVFVIPLSLFEVFVGVWICRKLSPV